LDEETNIPLHIMRDQELRPPGGMWPRELLPQEIGDRAFLEDLILAMVRNPAVYPACPIVEMVRQARAIIDEVNKVEDCEAGVPEEDLGGK
jgi:hypothetical protein